jgi:predicted membrane protein
MEEQNIHSRKPSPNGRRWAGAVLLLVGGVLLLRQTGYPMPSWLFTWPMILIVFGLFVGAKHRFTDFSWLVFIFIGSVFLADEIYPGLNLKLYTIPIVIMAVGLLFILSPRRNCNNGRFRGRFRNRFRDGEFGYHPEPAAAKPVQDSMTGFAPEMSKPGQDTILDVTSIFGGVKKKVLSKQFQGGEVTCVFGGAEINLSNADFNSPISIDVTNIFGGTKFIIPANWEVRSEVTAIFGGIDDKRPQTANVVPEKTIVLNGTIMFGGVEVNSF